MTGDAWLTIMWDGAKWVRHMPMRSNFQEHLSEFNDLIDTAHMHEPPIDTRLYKSIHKCWLDDIANWESPFESDQPALCANDTRELRKFRKYLVARQRYGDAVLLKRKFWRKYLGVDNG